MHCDKLNVNGTKLEKLVPIVFISQQKKFFNGPYELAPRSSPTMDKLPQLGATDSIV